MDLIIGNIIALIASFLMVYIGFIKEKNKIIYIQSIQIGLFIFSNLILGGITGAIINAISLVRNILCYKDKLGLKEKIIISILSIVTSLMFNNLGLLGLTPLISTVVYIWFMNIKDVKKFKGVVIFTVLMWLIYDLTIKSYTSAIFDFMSIVSNAYGIYMLKKNVK